MTAPAAARIAEANTSTQNLAGKLVVARDVRDHRRILAAVTGNSSMAMHAAAAFRKPCLVLLGGWFPSASAHAAQWGYPETKLLGKESGRPDIYTPEEVARLGWRTHFSQTS